MIHNLLVKDGKRRFSVSYTIVGENLYLKIDSQNKMIDLFDSMTPDPAIEYKGRCFKAQWFRVAKSISDHLKGILGPLIPHHLFIVGKGSGGAVASIVPAILTAFRYTVWSINAPRCCDVVATKWISKHVDHINFIDTGSIISDYPREFPPYLKTEVYAWSRLPWTAAKSAPDWWGTFLKVAELGGVY